MRLESGLERISALRVDVHDMNMIVVMWLLAAKILIVWAFHPNCGSM